MKIIQQVVFFVFAFLCCTSYADENKYIFVGQNENDSSPAFVLELLNNDIEQHCYISEGGEVYLKVDKVLAIPKDAFKQLFSMGNVSSMQNALSVSMKDHNDTERQYCPHCKEYYWSTRGNRHCTNCGAYN